MYFIFTFTLEKSVYAHLHTELSLEECFLGEIGKGYI